MKDKYKLYKENLEWFCPDLFKKYPPQEGEWEEFINHDERGKPIKGFKRGWNYFNVYQQAKVWRGRTIHELWETSFNSGDSWIGYVELLTDEKTNKPIPEHNKDFIAKEIFMGKDNGAINSAYKLVKKHFSKMNCE